MYITRDSALEAADRLFKNQIEQGFVFQGLYIYTDQYRNGLFCRVRYLKPDGEKFIRPIRYSDGVYEMGEPKFNDSKPIYNLHVIFNQPEEIVFVVEGENKVKGLNKLLDDAAKNEVQTTDKECDDKEYKKAKFNG